MRDEKAGIIGWFAQNRVAANLIMVSILGVGTVTGLFHVRTEVFPEIAPNMISVTVPYPGASPTEVEEAICVRVEEQVYGLSGVRRILSVANESLGVVQIEAMPEADLRALLSDVKSRVDAIETFPVDAERPVVEELVIRNQVINVAVHGKTEEATLKQLGERVRDEISALPGISLVELVSTRPYEIAIELGEEALRRHGLTFDEVATAVRKSSLDLPGGTIRTRSGEILVRTKAQAYRGREFEDLVLRTRGDGTRVLLRDVARVVDGFADTDQMSRFDGEPAVLVQVFRVGDQNALDVSRIVQEYVELAQARMPAGTRLTTWLDQAEFLRGRLSLLLEDAGQGFVLVFLMLALFLRLRLAFWVCLDIPVSFLGAVALMPWFDVSINMISLFSFIIVLGIVVDDAIVVGENVHRHDAQLGDRLLATIRGAREVAISVTFGVMTTMAAFLPMLAVPGPWQKIWRVVPIIVIATLVFSLLDSKLVLPAHIAHMRPENPNPRGLAWLWARVQDAANGLLALYVRFVQAPLLATALRLRYATVAVFVSVLLLIGGMVGAGWIRFFFIPPIEGDYVVANLVMPQGTPAEVTQEAILQIERAAQKVTTEFERELGGTRLLRHMLASVGDQPYQEQQRRNSGSLDATGKNSAHLGEVTLELVPAERREISAERILERWRQETGTIADAVALSFSASIVAAGADIDLQLSASNLDTLQAAAVALKQRLASYEGIADVTDSHRGGKQELLLRATPAAETLGITQRDLARQVRQAFYGEEAQRVQRGRDDVKVMVRYPSDDRRAVATLETMRVRTPAGDEVPFGLVAAAQWAPGTAAIKRADRGRTINVTADVDETRGNANEVIADLEATCFPQLIAAHPGLRIGFEGQQRNQRETLASLAVGFAMILFLIYALMAVPLRSYLQPLVVMTAIPFGLVGAVLGHVVLGLPLSIMSMFGLVALAGVAVNDSLVLVEFINQLRREGMPLLEAVTRASLTRFRAIMLTSGTTFVGLMPLVLNKSVQAQFLIPMGVSLAFGSMFATLVSLILVPSLYVILEDLRRRPSAVPLTAPTSPRPSS